MMDFRAPELAPKYPVITLSPGQGVIIKFHESDGEITTEYTEKAVKVTADLADSNGRGGEGNEVIYEEHFSDEEDDITADRSCSVCGAGHVIGKKCPKKRSKK